MGRISDKTKTKIPDIMEIEVSSFETNEKRLHPIKNNTP